MLPLVAWQIAVVPQNITADFERAVFLLWYDFQVCTMSIARASGGVFNAELAASGPFVRCPPSAPPIMGAAHKS